MVGKITWKTHLVYRLIITRATIVKLVIDSRLTRKIVTIVYSDHVIGICAKKSIFFSFFFFLFFKRSLFLSHFVSTREIHGSISLLIRLRCSSVQLSVLIVDTTYRYLIHFYRTSFLLNCLYDTSYDSSYKIIIFLSIRALRI